MENIHSKLLKYNINQILNIIQIFLMFYWLTGDLRQSDSNYGIYLICGILAFLGIVKGKIELKKKENIILKGISVLFSVIVILANYHLIENVIDAGMMLVGGYYIGWYALLFLYGSLINYNLPERFCKKDIKPCVIFLISFVVIVIIDLLYLFLCDYPGNLSPDSIGQVGQVLANSYTNHHPFWHTIIIKICIQVGMHLFGEINATIALYCVVQILFMATCFSLAIVTLYQLNVSYGWIFCAWSCYALMPYHINYSTTVWKDVMFGGGVLLFVVSMFRLLFAVGKNKALNYYCFICGCMCFGLLRNNGLIALCLVLLSMVIIFKSKYKKIYLLLAITIVASYILKGPFLDAIGVRPTGIQESLSIPCQQIARVVVEGEEITEEQRKKIDRLLDTNRIPELYRPELSDPIKFNIDTQYLSEHKEEYLLLWIELGVEHPLAYIKAWIDQTKGYWNGGYTYWISSFGVAENELGIYHIVNSQFAQKIAYNYIMEWEKSDFWGFTYGIGFHVWIIALLALLNYFRGNKEKALMSFPVLCVVCTLLIATPVYSEFRYAYAVFTCVPFLIMMTFCKGVQGKNG